MSRTKTITLTLGSLAAGAVIATGVTGMALAAGSSPSPDPTTAATPGAPQHGIGAMGDGMRGDRGPGGPGELGRPGGPGRPGGDLMGAPGSEPLHGEAVVQSEDGSISTVRMIHGAVTAVNATSISVKAADGYTATYVITATTDIHAGLPDRSATATVPVPDQSTAADVKVGDVAMVVGTVSGSDATATRIHALTAEQDAQLQAEHDLRHQGATPTAS